MSNNKSKISKEVSFRVPITIFMELLEKAGECNMNRTDYLLQLLIKRLNGKLVEIYDGDEIYTKEMIDDLQLAMNIQYKEKSWLNDEIKRLAEKCEQLEEANVFLRKKIKGQEIMGRIKGKILVNPK
jgi:hypothetical protein